MSRYRVPWSKINVLTDSLNTDKYQHLEFTFPVLVDDSKEFEDLHMHRYKAYFHRDSITPQFVTFMLNGSAHSGLYYRQQIKDINPAELFQAILPYKISESEELNQRLNTIEKKVEATHDFVIEILAKLSWMDDLKKNETL